MKNSKLTQLIADFEAAQKTFQENGKKALTEAVREFFNDYPEVTSLSWTQFAPYFNDGDECVFSVHPLTASNASDGTDSISYGEYEGDEEDVWVYDGDYGSDEVPPHIDAALDEFSSLIQSDSLSDLFRSLFGNHTRVTCTREGIKTDSYDHHD